MANINYEVWHFPTGTTGSENITGAISLSEKEGINTEADIFSFKVINKNKEFADKLVYGDYIKVNAGYDNDLKTIGWGKIEEEEHGLSSSANYKLVKGAGPGRLFQDYLANQVIKAGETYTVGDYSFGTDAINSRNIFKLMVENFINNRINNVDDKIKWDTYVDSTSGCEAWSTRISEAFFKVWANKPVVDVLSEIRGDSFTGNGDYDFWIDGDNEAHFEPIGDTNYPKRLIEGENILSYKISRDIKPNFTVATIFLGNDDLNRPVTVTAINGTTRAKYGWKNEFFNWGNYYDNIKAQFPESGGGTAPEVNYLRTKAVEAAKPAAEDFVNREGVPKWKGNISIRGDNEYRITSGTRVNADLPSVSAGLIGKDFIIKNVKNDITARKWVTTIDVEERWLGEFF